MKLRLPAIALLSLFFFSHVLWADVDPASQMKNFIESVTKQMAEMQKTIEQQNQLINRQNEKIQQLEDRQPQVRMAPSGEGAAAPMSDYEYNQRLETALGGANKWLKDLKFSGDIRGRYEAFLNHSGNPAEDDPRNRFRYRLRYGFEKVINPDTKIGFSMASGEAPTGATSTGQGTNADPTSTNQTLGNLFNYKNIWIERVYAIFIPAFAKVGPISATEIGIGKFNNPFEKGSSDMIWDRDVKPEGIYEKVDIKLLNSENLRVGAYGTAGQFILRENATLGSDSELYAQQVGLNAVVYTPFFDRPVDFLTAGSYYAFHNYAQKSNFILNGTSLARGNVNIDGATTELDARHFDVIESYSEIAVYPYGLPTRLFFDIAQNASDRSEGDGLGTVGGENLAFSFGTKLGGIVKKGDWEGSYAYKRIGANSVVGAFNDSDFGYNGHANGVGSVFKLGYALADNWTLNAAAFYVNNLAQGAPGLGTRGMDEQQQRYQIDTVWKF